MGQEEHGADGGEVKPGIREGLVEAGAGVGVERSEEEGRKGIGSTGDRFAAEATRGGGSALHFAGVLGAECSGNRQGV